MYAAPLSLLFIIRDKAMPCQESKKARYLPFISQEISGIAQRFSHFTPQRAAPGRWRPGPRPASGRPRSPGDSCHSPRWRPSPWAHTGPPPDEVQHGLPALLPGAGAGEAKVLLLVRPVEGDGHRVQPPRQFRGDVPVVDEAGRGRWCSAGWGAGRPGPAAWSWSQIQNRSSARQVGSP